MRTSQPAIIDGTIADLYGVDNLLEVSSVISYQQAKPMTALADLLKKFRDSGTEIHIITWLPKGATLDYSREIYCAKLDWLSAQNFSFPQLKVRHNKSERYP